MAHSQTSGILTAHMLWQSTWPPAGACSGFCERLCRAVAEDHSPCSDPQQDAACSFAASCCRSAVAFEHLTGHRVKALVVAEDGK